MNPLKQGPAIPHLGSGRGGVKGEVARLRQQALQGVLATLGRDLLWSNGDGDAKTWKEVMDIVALSPVGPSITPRYLPENSGMMPIPTGVWDLRRAKFVADSVGSGSATVVVEEGAVLKDVRGLFSTGLHFNGGLGSVSPKFTWTVPDPGNVIVLLCMFGGGIQNDSQVPVIRVPNGDNPLILAAVLGGGIGPGASPAISLGPGAVLYTFNVESTTGLALGDDTVVSDDNTALLIHGHTGNFAGFPNMPGFLGTQINIPFALDGGSGPTAARPLNLNAPNPAPGTKYYDTTLDLPIVANAAGSWVDYAGNPV